MLRRDIPSHDMDWGIYKRRDGESFKVVAKLYESPPDIDYWLVPIDAEHVPVDTKHTTWGHMRFTLMIPKKIAATLQLATALARGPTFDQVKAALENATAKGRDLGVCFSHDGWVLV